MNLAIASTLSFIINQPESRYSFYNLMGSRMTSPGNHKDVWIQAKKFIKLSLLLYPPTVLLMT